MFRRLIRMRKSQNVMEQNNMQLGMPYSYVYNRFCVGIVRGRMHPGYTVIKVGFFRKIDNVRFGSVAHALLGNVCWTSLPWKDTPL